MHDRLLTAWLVFNLHEQFGESLISADEVQNVILDLTEEIQQRRKIVSFATATPAKGSKQKTCKKGYSCGYTCISKTRNCKSPLPGQAATYAAWLATQAGGAPAAAPTPPPKAAKTPKAAPIAAPPSPLKTNDTELQTQRSTLVQRFGQATVAAAERNVQKILSDPDTNVYVRLGSASTLEKILSDRFKSSAELGITSHQIPDLQDKNYQNARNRTEAKVLGYAAATKPADRPIYGYLGGKDLQGASHQDVASAYGSIAIKLKSEIKDRTTFTGADSFKSGIASPINNTGAPPPPNAASLAALTRFGYDIDDPAVPAHLQSIGNAAQRSQLKTAAAAKTIDDLNNLAPTGNKYLEAQVHGKVTPNDIAELHFSPRGTADRPTAAIAQFAKDNNVPLFVNGKPLNATELDAIITPPKDKRSQNLKDLASAIAAGDIDTVVATADRMHQQASQIKLNPGETDALLKYLYAESGFDGLPKVGTKADLDNAARSGATLMSRGVNKAAPPDPPDQYLKTFQSGDYFVGNGIYGNGTYVGHSGSFKNGQFVHGNNATTSLNAVKNVAKHNYITANNILFRMALDPSAVVMTQDQIATQIAQIDTQLDAWKQKQIQALKQKVNRVNPDLAKVQAAAKTVEASYATKPHTITQRKPVAARGGFDIAYTLAYAGEPPHTFKIRREPPDPLDPLSSGKATFLYTSPSGDVQAHKNQKAAERAAIADFYLQKAAQNLGMPGIPSSTLDRQQLQDLDDRVDRVKTFLYGDQGNGCSGRFAVIQGADAIALNDSYQSDVFMNLLNRTQVLVQDVPLRYKTGMKKGVGI